MLTPRSVSLLAGAIRYAVANVREVTPDQLANGTPCGDWNLRELLAHVTDSLSVLRDSLDAGYIAPDGDLLGGQRDGNPSAADSALDAGFDVAAAQVGTIDVTTAFCDMAHVLLIRLGGADPRVDPLLIGDRQLGADLMADTIAIELAVHGWDVSRACGRRRPIPAALAAEMLRAAKFVVTDEIRPQLFAPAVAVEPTAAASDRLVAYLGRDPYA